MKRALSVLGLTVVACVSMAQGAFAAAQDYSSLTTRAPLSASAQLGQWVTPSSGSAAA